MIEDPLFDVDALGLVAWCLGDHDAQDTILEVSLDGVLVDTRGEAESAMELPNRTLGNPVLGAMLLISLSGSTLLDSLSILFGILGGLVLNGSFVALASVGHIASDAATGLVRAFGGVFALDTALDDESVGIGEFDVDVLLVETGEFALELVGFFVLADIELGLEGADGGIGGERAVVVVVVKKTEEWRDIARGKAWEERHCSCVVLVE